MRMLKAMIIAIMSVVMILSGCAKDEVVPIKEETADLEQSNEESTSKNQAEQKATTASEEQAKAEESAQEQKESSENSTNSNTNNNDESNKVGTTKEEVKESTEEPTVQKSTTSSTTNKSTKNKEVKDSTTTQKSQTNTDKKTTTSESNDKQTETVKEQTTTPPPKKEEPKQTVTISIIGDQQIGIILSKTKVEIKEGDTVLDVTLNILKQKGKQISVTGSGSSAYVQSIDNLAEFKRGPLSGWTVQRNGAKLNRSADAIQVKNGDSIQWIYTSNYEEDGR